MMSISPGQCAPRSGHGRRAHLSNAMKRETTKMLVNMATRVGLSYALALFVLAGLMMIVNG